MYQFYFLSILLNLLVGAVLAHDLLEDRIPALSGFLRDVSERRGFLAGLGAASFIVGFFKLLSVTRGDVPVVGDLFPALAGLLGGGTLIFEYYRDRATVYTPLVTNLSSILVNNRSYWGIAALVAAVLHFIFPSVLFL